MKQTLLTLTALLAMTGSLFGCAQTPTPTSPLEMRVASTLSPEAETWLAEIKNTANFKNPTGTYSLEQLGASGRVQDLSRHLNLQLEAVLAALRVTGDVELLEKVYTVMQLERSTLRLHGDAYLDWWYYNPDEPALDKTDKHVMEEILAHSIVAQAAYAFRVNAELDPKYAEAADFWQDYLINHYEAKWRKRTGKLSGYPIIQKPLAHPYANQIQYHHYMFELTGNVEYQVERDREVAVLMRHLMPDGPAFTWSHFVNELIAPANRGWIHQPVGYSGESLSALADLGFEGVLDTETMTKLAASVTVNLLDGKSPGIMASDVGSAQPGLYFYPFLNKFVNLNAPAYDRGTAFFFQTRGYALLSAFDSTGEIERTSARLAGDTFFTPAVGALLGAVSP